MWRAPPGYGDTPLRPAKRGRLKHAVTVRESADLIQVPYGSCNGESSDSSLLSVCVKSYTPGRF